ncbi:hypothetical protein Tco_1171445 [Tanacetum coccineum]
MVDLKNNILSNTIMAVKILMLKPSSRMDGMEEDVLDIEAQENLITFYEIPMGSRVDLVAYKLKGGAQSSWKNLQLIRERQGKLPITSCERMERELRRRFLPPNHDQILFNLLQNYLQGNRSVEVYTSEFHRLSSRINILSHYKKKRFLGRNFLERSKNGAKYTYLAPVA